MKSHPVNFATLRSAFCCIATSILLTGLASADDLTGVVLDVDGQPVAGVTVKLITTSLMSVTPMSLLETKTDSDGNFTVAVPDAWFDAPEVFRQELSLIVETNDRGNGGIVIYRELPLPRHRLTIQLEPWAKRKIVLRSADDKPLARATVKLTGLQLPVIYPARFEQSNTRQLAPIPDSTLQSSGMTDADGVVELLLPPLESVASIYAEIEKGVFVSWSVHSSNSSVPKGWSEELQMPTLRRLPIQVKSGDGNLGKLQLSVTSMPRTSSGATTLIANTVDLDATGNATAVIQDEAILTLKITNPDSANRFLSQGWIENSTTVERLDLTFEQGVSVTGRAIATDGTPAANIRLFAMSNGANLDVATDADGRFKFAAPVGQMILVPTGRSGYRLEAFTPESVITIPESKDGISLGDITLTRLKSLKGVVIDTDGKPVSGARVTAFWDESHPRSPQLVVNRQEHVTTIEDGTFVVPDLAPKANVTVMAAHDGAVTERMISLDAKDLDDPVSLTITHAATIAVSGRITDQAGDGISDVPVTLRHRLTVPVTEAEAPIGEDVADVRLVSDETGNYATAKTLPPWGEYIAVIRAGTKRQAISGWKSAVSGKPLELPLIEDSRTSEISGRILTLDGKPVANARVVVLTNQDQAETRSLNDGSFTIDRPVGRGPLLIAEADGHLANGTPVDHTATGLKILLPKIDELLQRSVEAAQEPQEPMAWTVEQKRQLALKLVDGLQDVDPQSKTLIDTTIARYFSDHVLQKLETLPAAKEMNGQRIRSSLAMGLAPDRPQEGLRLLDEFPDGPMKVYMLVHFEPIANLNRDDRLQLLARIVQDARALTEAEHRTVAIGLVGERLLDLGERERGESLLREGLEDAKKLAPAAWSAYARGAFAEELSQVDPDAALALIEPLTDNFEFNRHLQNIAHELASIDPDRAVALLGKFREPDANRRPIADERESAALRVCYRMVRVAPEKAIELARTIKHMSLRPYCFSLMAESLLSQDKVGDAHSNLARQLHDEAWQLLSDVRKNIDQSEVAYLYPSTVAALLLQQTAILAPEQLPHRVWQTIALRRPIGDAGEYQNAGQDCCCQLALLLSEVDRTSAEQVSRWLPNASSAGSQFTTWVGSSRSAAELIVALHPDQCEAALEAVTIPSSQQRLRLSLVKALVRTGAGQERAIRNEMALWFPDDEDMGPID